MLNEKILEFYKKTSCYTDLGYYKDFASKLPNNINELCILQRKQIIHPADLKHGDIRNKKHEIYGDVSEIPFHRINFEDDILPTGVGMLAELLRKDPNYSGNRGPNDRVNVTCRGQAILLTSILKAKGVSARTRSGFVEYIKFDGIYRDHWIVEYYDKHQQRWVLVDPDCSCSAYIIKEINIFDIPRNRFLTGAQAWMGLRKKEYNEKTIYYSSAEGTWGYLAAIRALFYDFHCLMNDEIMFLHLPKYIVEKNFELDEIEHRELDELAKLMLDPDKHFESLQKIWKENIKLRIMVGALNV